MKKVLDENTVYEIKFIESIESECIFETNETALLGYISGLMPGNKMVVFVKRFAGNFCHHKIEQKDHTWQHSSCKNNSRPATSRIAYISASAINLTRLF